MDKDEAPEIRRRTTRSSLYSTPISKTLTEVSNAAEKHPSSKSINGLTFHGESISVEDLSSCFPGRRAQIDELIRSLGPLSSPMPPLFIYGSVSTGKTSTVLGIFKHLKRPFVYCSFITCYSPGILFESVLNQLLLHVKDESNDYSSAKKCEKPSDFINLLREALATLLNGLKGSQGKSGSKKSSSQVNGNMIYMIFDNLDVVGEWDKSFSMIALLFNLYGMLKMPEVGLIFIGRTSLDTLQSETGFAEPFPIYFPDYTEDDLCHILVKNQKYPKLYSSFLELVLRPFYRITRRVDELHTALSPLFKKYCEPLEDLGDVPNADMKRQLFSRIQPFISLSLNETFSVPSWSSLQVLGNKEGNMKKNVRKKLGVCETSNVIDFHMSTSSKYLLISAFLASRNPATLDASFFDSTGGLDNRKRKRKSSEKSMERKEIKEQEQLMKGPGTFPLERLLAIYQCISSVDEDSADGEDLECGRFGTNDSNNGLMSDILLQLSSLCNANFITKGGSCPLEGSTRYRSTISEDMALQVARSLKFPLSKYLYRR